MGQIQNLLKEASSGGGKCRKPLLGCLIAEFIGTALLLFLGCGSGMRLEHEGARSLVGIALCWGFTIASLAQTLGGYSCDINPAITLACLVTGRTTILKAILYIIVQCLGSLAGIYALTLVMPATVVGTGMTSLAYGVTPLQGCLIEAVTTFFLAFTVFSATDNKRNDVQGSVPLSIGLCVAGIILCSGPYTGASLNPARSLGPSIVAGKFVHHWVYWVGPTAGGIIGGLLYHHLFRVRGKGEEPSPVSV